MARRFAIGDLDVLIVSHGPLAVPPTVYYQRTTDDWQRHKSTADACSNLASIMIHW